MSEATAAQVQPKIVPLGKLTDQLPNANREAGVFWRLRRSVGRAIMRESLESARLRTALIVGLTLAFWGIMFGVFAEGFGLIRTMITHEGTRAETVHAIFNVFFLSLLAMLTLSSAILMYSGLYRSREARFLLTNPIRVRRVALYKFQEAALLSGWGFLLLGTPLLFAYGMTAGAPLSYFLSLLPFLISFVFIPVSAGAVLCLIVVRYLPRLRFQAFGFVAVVTIVVLAAVGWMILREVDGEHSMNVEWFQQTLSRLQYSEQYWLPSWWLSSGLLEAAHPAESNGQSSWRESMGFLCVLMSNALFAYLAVGWVAARVYLPGYNGLADLGGGKKRRTRLWVDSLVENVASIARLPKSMQLLLVKDLRMFRRDVLQWSQFAIFFLLLSFYFINVRKMTYTAHNPGWMLVVGFLNVTVVGLLLATFTTRFIFPLLSLEGRRFWVLGTLPIRRSEILMSKFVFSLGISLLPCASLILLSDLMLQLYRYSPWVLVQHQITCAALCCGLCGIAVGLGARFPNLREASAARIASSFGGTLTLVISVCYILVSVVITGVPAYAWVRAGKPPLVWSSWGSGSVLFMVIGCLATVGVAIATTWLPLRSGLRAFEELER